MAHESWPSGPGRDARTVLEPTDMPAQLQETQGRHASRMPVERPLIALTCPIESELGVFELELVRAADARGLPVSPICLVDRACQAALT